MLLDRKAGLSPVSPKSGAPHPQKLLISSASRPTRETATRLASRVVLEYGWVTPLEKTVKKTWQ